MKELLAYLQSSSAQPQWERDRREVERSSNISDKNRGEQWGRGLYLECDKGSFYNLYLPHIWNEYGTPILKLSELDRGSLRYSVVYKFHLIPSVHIQIE